MSEWELRVSQKELHRMHVVRLTMEGRETVGRGARLLRISARQMKRLRRKMKERGVQGLLHGNRGKAPWNKTVSEKIEQVLKLARGRYQGLNDTHLTEKLKEKEKIVVSRATVRTILRQAGIAAVRKRGVKRHYKRRERRAQEGALLLWDGSPHHWFGQEQGEWSLMAVIDDATGALLHGVFALQEDAQSYLICLRQILLEKGIPLALYMDRHGIFRRNDDHWSLQEQLAGEQAPTQVGQALRELGIEAIFALSPQAKGRVERLFNTLQDRLVQELRLAGIASPQQATSFVNGPFKADFNARFAKPARQSQAAWRPLLKRYLAKTPQLAGVVHLLDIRREPSDDDIAMLDLLAELEMPVIVVLTKRDKLSRKAAEDRAGEIARQLELDADQVILFSAVTGEGRDELAGAIMSAVAGANAR